MSASRAAVAAITMARGDTEFLNLWIRHHGAAFGAANLFVLLDGQDQPLPDAADTVNLLRLPHVPRSRTQGDRARARAVSHVARALFHHYSCVIACDADELLCLDPAAGVSLADYLTAAQRPRALWALGLDLGQRADEAPLDFKAPILQQRRSARISARYTKAVVARAPLTWGSGFHRAKGCALHIDPQLYLFHLGLADRARAQARAARPDLLAAGWAGHFDRRSGLLDALDRFEPQPAQPAFAAARRRMFWRRPLYALNKPGAVADDLIVAIPESWRDLF